MISRVVQTNRPMNLSVGGKSDWLMSVGRRPITERTVSVVRARLKVARWYRALLFTLLVFAAGIVSALVHEFGREDILIDNRTWMLRRFPVFGVCGDGSYPLQPIFVDDLANLAVQYGAGSDNPAIDAMGPETFTYRELVAMIGDIIRCRRTVISVAPAVGYYAGVVLGRLVDDVVITRNEIRGLKDGLLCVESPPSGETRLTDWDSQHRSELGRGYASDLARRRTRAG